MLSFSVQDKIIFKASNITGDKQGQIIMIKESIHQEDITTINIYTHNPNGYVMVIMVIFG